MLTVQNLYKSFGSNVAVNNVSFELEPGQILGMIGRNGSGKTTIFRIILDFLSSENDGKVLWNHEPMSKQLYHVVGYLPEERGLYEKLTIGQQISYFARLRGMDEQVIQEKTDYWMNKFQVKGKVTDKILTLSKGNQQKVQLISTLIHEPKLLILDEPFSGLDPVNADLLMAGILELKEKGSAIIFSSHNMNNVEELCDKLVMIHDGDQLLYGTVEEVREQFGRTRLFIESLDWDGEALASLAGVKEVKTLKNHQFKLILEDQSFGPAIYEQVTKGQYISLFSQQPPTLEEIFKLKAGGSHE